MFLLKLEILKFVWVQIFKQTKPKYFWYVSYNPNLSQMMGN